MKTLIDNKKVSSSSYYYLLDWNEHNEWNFIKDNFQKSKLKDLTISEYLELFQYVASQEIEILKRKINIS